MGLFFILKLDKQVLVGRTPSILTLSKRENLPLGVSHLDYPILEGSNLNLFGFIFYTV